ncbi:hypothetical protein A9R00_10965, partial [Oleispira antarctica]
MFKISFILSIIIFSSFSQARQSCDWPFRTAINITETSGQNTSNYSVKLTLTGNSGGTLHSSYNWSSDGADLRLYSSNDSTLLNFSIESWDQSNKSAVIWVTLPSFNANSQHTVYVYYGNASVPTADSGTPPGIIYVDDQIKFHTRYNDQNTNDPTSLSHAKALFDAQDDSVAGYGCSHPVQYQDIDNATQGGVNHDFIAVSEAYFTVPSSGQWGVRYGADYGLGGGLYVNGIALDERWNEDLWWGGSDWNNADVLQGVLNLSAGEHKLEVIGGEGCCDGGLTIQFYNGSTDTWGLASDPNVNINIRSQACPVIRHTIQYGAHDVCSMDLQFDKDKISTPRNWNINQTQELSLQIKNDKNALYTATLPILVQIQLPAGQTHAASIGNDWMCSGTSGTISCSYNKDIVKNNKSSVLTLTIFTNRSAISPSSITASVSNNQPDADTSNNTVTDNTNVKDKNTPAPAITPSCGTSPPNGIWSRFFDIQSYADTTLDNAADYQTIVDDRVKATYLDGQTVFGNINGSGNPFDNRNDDYYLTLFEGYIYAPEDGTYTFGVDGDDAIEVWIDGLIASTFYGLHGENGS